MGIDVIAAERTANSSASLPTQVIYPKIRWAVLACTCLAVIAFQVSVMSYSPILGEIGKSLGIPLAQSVNLMSFFMLFAAISFFAAGPFCDKFGVAATTILSTVFSAVPGALTLWLGQAYSIVVLIRVLQGCAVGFALGALAPLVLRWFPAEQRGIALGIPGACNVVGALLGVLLSPALFKASGDWRWTVAMLSIFGWVALVYCVVVFTIAKPKAPQASLGFDQQKASSLFKAALANPITWVGVLATFCVNWIMQSAFSLSPSYFAEPKPVGLDLGPMAAGQLMGIMQIGAMIGPIVGGILLDKVFGGRTSKVLWMGYLLALIYAALQLGSVYNNKALFIVTLILSGAGIGMLFPLMQSQISETYEQHIVGRMNGVWLGIGAFGGSAGLFANSIALKSMGNYVLPINIISAAAVVGLLLCPFLRLPRRQAGNQL
jgi:MFS family permease